MQDPGRWPDFLRGEPPEYEELLGAIASDVQKDPLRDLLVFPDDDWTECVLPREFRTVHLPVPAAAIADTTPEYVRQCVKAYINNWNLIVRKYTDYTQSVGKTVQDHALSLKDHVFQVQYGTLPPLFFPSFPTMALFWLAVRLTTRSLG